MSERSRRPRLWPVRAPGSHIVVRDGRPFVTSADGTVMVAVNTSAAALWELCDGTTAIDEIVTAICDLTSISHEQATSEVNATIKDFAQVGLLSVEQSERSPAERQAAD